MHTACTLFCLVSASGGLRAGARMEGAASAASRLYAVYTSVTACTGPDTPDKYLHMGLRGNFLKTRHPPPLPALLPFLDQPTVPLSRPLCLCSIARIVARWDTGRSYNQWFWSICVAIVGKENLIWEIALNGTRSLVETLSKPHENGKLIIPRCSKFSHVEIWYRKMMQDRVVW